MAHNDLRRGCTEDRVYQMSKIAHAADFALLPSFAKWGLVTSNTYTEHKCDLYSLKVIVVNIIGMSEEK